MEGSARNATASSIWFQPEPDGFRSSPAQNLRRILPSGDITCKIMVNQANCTNHTFDSQVIHIIHSNPQKIC